MTRRLADITADMTEAAARLNEAISRIDAAWRSLHEQQPGFPSGDTGNTESASQPERLHATWRNDPAIVDLDRLDRAAHRALGEATVVYDVATRWGPATMRTSDRDGPGDDWCLSCWRLDRRCEPVAHTRYARYCRWCGDFYGTYRIEPPLELLRARQRGRRITTAMVTRALIRAGHPAPNAQGA